MRLLRDGVSPAATWASRIASTAAWSRPSSRSKLSSSSTFARALPDETEQPKAASRATIRPTERKQRPMIGRGGLDLLSIVVVPEEQRRGRMISD
eukprot:scaffold112924_cov27-Prasinocladus_malaysianus.AAC.1